MDTYLALHRDRQDKRDMRAVTREIRPSDQHHDKHDKFNTTFPSLHDLTDGKSDGQPTYPKTPPTNSPYHRGRNEAISDHIDNVPAPNSVTLTPELFEKLYLSPQHNVNGNLRSTFGNPTPLALLGFLLSLSPLSCELMGWRGAAGDGIATVGAYYFIGGFLMSLGGVLEFFLGNTFSFVVFCSFGGFWLTLGSTLTPTFNAYGAYAMDTNHPEQGLDSAGFHASFGFFLLFMGLMSFIYLICALRTNLVFVTIFAGLLLTFVVLTGSYWNLAEGNVAVAEKLQVAAGAFGFLAVMAGWWIFFAQMLQSVEFPLTIPVGDISHMIPPLSARVNAKELYAA